MLSDEEKKAIDYLQLCYDLSTITNESLSKLGIVLNLIEKQSKEIEEAEQKERKAYIDGTNVAHELCNKKWKDKIKTKIEEINKEMLNEENSLELFYRKKYCKEVLQSLLEKE